MLYFVDRCMRRIDKNASKFFQEKSKKAGAYWLSMSVLRVGRICILAHLASVHKIL